MMMLAVKKIGIILAVLVLYGLGASLTYRFAVHLQWVKGDVEEMVAVFWPLCAPIMLGVYLTDAVAGS